MQTLLITVEGGGPVQVQPMMRSIAEQLGVPVSSVSLGSPVIPNAPVNITVSGAAANVTLTNLRTIAAAANASRASAAGSLVAKDPLEASLGGSAVAVVVGAAAAAAVLTALGFSVGRVG